MVNRCLWKENLDFVSGVQIVELLGKTSAKEVNSATLNADGLKV